MAVDTSMFATVMSPHLKHRIFHKKAPKILSADSILMGHLKSMAHTIAWAETVDKLRAVFRDEGLQNAINQRGGRNQLVQLNKVINDFARGTVERGLMSAELDKIRSKFASSKIALNLFLYPIQRTSELAYLTELPPGMKWEWMSARLQKLIGGKVTKAELNELYENSSLLQTREYSGYTKELANLFAENRVARVFFRKSSFKRGGKLSKILSPEALTLVQRKGDVHAIIAGGFGQYKAWLKYYQSAEGGNLNRDEARTKAIEKFEIATRKWQQSGAEKDRTNWERQGALARLANPFLSTPQAYFRNFSVDIAHGLHGDKSIKYKAAMTIGIIMGMGALYGIVQGFRASFRDGADDDVILQAMLKESIVGPLGGGPFLNAAMNGILNSTIMGKDWDITIPVYDTMTDLFVKTPSSLMRGDYMKGVSYALSALSGTPIPIIGGMPLDPVRKQLELMWSLLDANDQRFNNTSAGYYPLSPVLP